MFLCLLLSYFYAPSIKINIIDILVYLFFLYSFLSIYWGDFNAKSILVFGALHFSYLLTYLIIRNFNFTFSLKTRHVYFIILCELIYMFTAFNGERAINGGYIVGHISSVALMLSFKKTKFTSIFVAIIYFFSSSLRFFAVAIMSLFKSSKLILFMGISALSFLYFLSNIVSPVDALYNFLLGYRIAEFANVINTITNNLYNFLFGLGFGQSTELVNLGTKGEIEHFGYYHNFYLTITQSIGIIGLILFILPLLFLLMNKSNYNTGLVVFMVMIAVDAHRDGIWPIYFFAAMALNEQIKLKNEKYSSNS